MDAVTEKVCGRGGRMTIDEAITRIKEFAEQQRVKVRTCGNCQYCKKGQIYTRQGYCYFYHYEHDLTQKACSNWETNDDIGYECADECEQIAEWLEELKEMWADQGYVGDFWYERGRQDAIDEFIKSIEEHQSRNWIDNLEYGITFADLEEVAEQLKGEQNG